MRTGVGIMDGSSGPMRELERRVANDGPDPALAVDVSGAILHSNLAARELFRADAAVGTQIDRTFGPGTGDWLAGCGPTVACREVRVAGFERLEARAIRRDPHGPAIVTVRPLDEPTERIEPTEPMRRLAVAGRLAGAVAHEINNPLTVLQLRTEMLIEDAAPSDSVRRQLVVLRDCASRIGRSVRVLQRVVHQARSARLATETSVEAIVEAGVASASDGGVEIHVDLRAGPQAAIRGDAQSLAFLVEVIASAAVEAGRPEVRVEVIGDALRIQVTSPGEDWPVGEIAAVTLSEDPEVQRRPAAVGLLVAGAVARAHGGRVVGRRCAEGGSALVVELPTANARVHGASARGARANAS